MDKSLEPGKTANERGRLVAFPTPAASAVTARPARRKYWLALVLVAAAATIALLAWYRAQSGSTVQYTLEPVTRGSIVRAVTATGTVNPELTIIVGTYVSGVIQELQCDYNTVVKKGQICAKIDPRPYQSIVDQARANLAVAEAELTKDNASLAYAKITYERNARLGQSNTVSRDVVDNAKNVYDQAQAQITFDEATAKQREAELAAAQVNLDYTNIISPVDGVVVSRNVTMGQTVAASFQTPTLFLIATDLTKMQVDTNVSESDIGGIKVGNKATFTVDAYPKRVFTGAVSQVRQSPQTVQNVVTYDVVVSVPNQDLALMPGMTAASLIVVDERDDVIRVPNQALRFRPAVAAGPAPPDQARIWVLRDGQPTAIPVVTGLSDDRNTEIVNATINPNDKVIVAEQATQNTVSLPRLRL